MIWCIRRDILKLRGPVNINLHENVMISWFMNNEYPIPSKFARQTSSRLWEKEDGNEEKKNESKDSEEVYGLSCSSTFFSYLMLNCLITIIVLNILEQPVLTRNQLLKSEIRHMLTCLLVQFVMSHWFEKALQDSICKFKFEIMMKLVSMMWWAVGVLIQVHDNAGQRFIGLLSSVGRATSHTLAKTCILILLLLLEQRSTMNSNQLGLSYSGVLYWPSLTSLLNQLLICYMCKCIDVAFCNFTNDYADTCLPILNSAMLFYRMWKDCFGVYLYLVISICFIWIYALKLVSYLVFSLQ